MPIDTSPPAEKLLVTAKEARTMLGIGKAKFQRWVKLGNAPRLPPCSSTSPSPSRRYARR